MAKATRRQMDTWSSTRRNILLVDDHPIMRASIREVLQQTSDGHTVHEASNAEDALSMLKAQPFDLTVIDLNLKEGSGLELLQQIREQNQTVRTLILSMHVDPFHIDAAIQFGAHGYVTKGESLDNLREAVQQVLKGQTYFSSTVESHLGRRSPALTKSVQLMPESCLTGRELHVLREIGRGYSCAEIAERLNLSVKTVHTHTEHIRAKLRLEHPSRLRSYATYWLHTATPESVEPAPVTSEESPASNPL